MTRPIPRAAGPDDPQGVPTPLSEVVLPPSDAAGAYDPTRRDPCAWFTQAMRDTHTGLIAVDADERTRFVVMRALMTQAVYEELALLWASAVYDPVIESILRELGYPT